LRQTARAWHAGELRMHSRVPCSLLCALMATLPSARGGAPAPQEPPAQGSTPAELRAALEKEGVMLDLEAGVLAFPARVLVREDLLEYLLVGPNGATHESLFVTNVRPSLLNAALLLLGVEPGTNAQWREGSATDEHGRPRKEVDPPHGDGVYLSAAWREGEETFFFRVEDLIANLESGRSLRRHRWVFLGSRFAALKPGTPEVFLADVEGNLVNLSFFFQGNTLVTSALEECIEQSIFIANPFLVPPRGSGVRLFVSRKPLETLAPAWAAELPVVAPEDGSSGDGR